MDGRRANTVCTHTVFMLQLLCQDPLEQRTDFFCIYFAADVYFATRWVAIPTISSTAASRRSARRCAKVKNASLSATVLYDFTAAWGSVRRAGETVELQERQPVRPTPVHVCVCVM